jgi:hypothetical protein
MTGHCLRLFTLANKLQARLTVAQRQVDTHTPALLTRAWTPSPPARPGFALSLCGIRRARSQCARLSGKLVPQDPTDEPASILLENIQSKREGFGQCL